MRSPRHARRIQSFRRAAHSLKSNAATFGAMTLSLLAKELEEMARENKLESTMDKLEPVSVAFANAQKTLKELQNG